MSENRDSTDGPDEKSAEQLDSKVIPVMREAVVTVQMVLFGQLKDKLAEKFSGRDKNEFVRIVGCIVSDLFGTPARDKESVEFAREHLDEVEKELWSIKDYVPEMLPFLTDALRMQTLCDHEEGVNSLPTLLRARAVGVLQEERSIPMPSTFMLAVRQMGSQYGLLEKMEVTDQGEG